MNTEPVVGKGEKERKDIGVWLAMCAVFFHGSEKLQKFHRSSA